MIEQFPPAGVLSHKVIVAIIFQDLQQLYDIGMAYLPQDLELLGKSLSIGGGDYLRLVDQFDGYLLLRVDVSGYLDLIESALADSSTN